MTHLTLTKNKANAPDNRMTAKVPIVKLCVYVYVYISVPRSSSMTVMLEVTRAMLAYAVSKLPIIKSRVDWRNPSRKKLSVLTHSRHTNTHTCTHTYIHTNIYTVQTTPQRYPTQ